MLILSDISSISTPKGRISPVIWRRRPPWRQNWSGLGWRWKSWKILCRGTYFMLYFSFPYVVLFSLHFEQVLDFVIFPLLCSVLFLFYFSCTYGWFLWGDFIVHYSLWNKYVGEPHFNGFDGTESGMIAQVANLTWEQTKLDIVPWGINAWGKTKWAIHGFRLLWAKSGPLLFTHEDSK